MTMPQNAEWGLKTIRPEMVTTKVTREPRLKAFAKAETKVCWRGAAWRSLPR